MVRVGPPLHIGCPGGQLIKYKQNDCDMRTTTERLSGAENANMTDVTVDTKDAWSDSGRRFTSDAPEGS